MSLPTLDEFLTRKNKFPTNSYVREDGFESLYVRHGQRYIRGKHYDAMDLANANALHPGKGAFTRLIHRLQNDYPRLGLYAENVLNTRMRQKLLSLGFVYVGPHEELPCYFLEPRQGGADAETPTQRTEEAKAEEGGTGA